jgi:hypothetical protein
MPASAELASLDLRAAAWAARNYLREEPAGYFLVMCCRENREVFEIEFRHAGMQAVFASTVEETLRYGFMLPPLAIVIDSYTATRVGSEKVSGLFNLGVNWPVMRATVPATGDVRVMCLEPAKSLSLCKAIEEIARGSDDWRHPRFFRKSMRIDIRTRARIRTGERESWRNANLLSISVGGGYLVLSEGIPTKGAHVELELLDLVEHPLHTEGKIAWRRTWDDGPDLPGVGVEFAADAVNSELRTALAETIGPAIRTDAKRPQQGSGVAVDSVFASIETREVAREFNW